MKSITKLLFLVVGLIAATDVLGQSVRIVGGADSTQDWPWMGRLVDAQVEDPLAPSAHICGATLIHPYWVVTAAHCVEGLSASQIHVVLGGHSPSEHDEAVSIPVAEIHTHADYSPGFGTLAQDIALVLLASPAEGFEPISLVGDESLTTEGVLAKVMGWGTLDEFGFSDLPDTLQEVDLPIVSLETANDPRSYDGELIPTMLAAGFHKGRADTCAGDSGGPLIVPNEDGSGWSLAGITSFGNGCAVPFQYGIYTRVSSFRPWILSFIHPQYGEWEMTNDVLGQFSDPDGDGSINLEEFASRSNPLNANSRPGFRISVPNAPLPARPVISYQQRTAGRAVDYHYFFSPDLSNWTQVNPSDISREEELIDENTVLTHIHLPARLLENQTGFFRREPILSNSLQPFTTPLALGQPFEGVLSSAFPTQAGANGPQQVRDMLLSLPSGEREILIQLSSNAFPPKLEILDSRTSEVVAREDNAAASDSIMVQIPTTGSADYILRISSAAEGGTGRFTIRSMVFPTDSVRPGRAISGQLSSSDLPHFSRVLGRISPVDAYLLDGIGENQFVEISVASASFPTAIELVNGRTGETLDQSAAFALFDDDELGSSVAGIRLDPNGVYIALVTGSDAERLGTYSVTVRTEELSEPGETPSIALGQSLDGTLFRTSPRRTHTTGQTFVGTPVELTGLQPDMSVIIDLSSEDFDAYLWLVDVETDEVILENDDSVDLDSRIVFDVPTDRAGADYLLFITSAFGDEFGDFTLSVSTQEISEPVEVSIEPISVGEFADGEITASDGSLMDESGNFVQGDLYELVGIESHELLAIELESPDFDAFLWLIDVENDEIILQDDDSGEGLDSRIVFELPQDREGAVFHVFVTTAFGNELGEYSLYVDPEEPMEPVEIITTPYRIGQTIGGRISSNDATRLNAFESPFLGDYYELTGFDPLQRVTFRLSSREIDPYIWLIDVENDEVIAQNDDFGDSTDSRLSFLVPEDRQGDTFYLFVTSAFGEDEGSYDLTSSTETIDAVQIGSRIESSIGLEDQDDPNFIDFDAFFFMEEFVLSSAAPGTEIHIQMTSDGFQGEVYVLNPTTNETIAWSREVAPPTATVSFTVEPQVSYVIRATSKVEEESGAYTLEISSTPQRAQQ